MTLDLTLKKVKSVNYLLRNVPADLWERVKIRAIWNQITVRDLIIQALTNLTKKGEK